MDVEGRERARQLIGERLRPEHAAAAIQHPDLAFRPPIPVAVSTRAASTRLNSAERAADSSIVRCSRRTRRRRTSPAPRDVVAFAAEALLAEVIGDAASGDGVQALFDRAAIAPSSRSISTKRFPASAPRGSLRACQACSRTRKSSDSSAARSGRDLLRQVHAEALPGHRMAVLQAGIAHAHFRHARPLRQALGGEGGVHAALLDRQQQVLAAAAGFEAGQLLDAEILGRGADRRREDGIAVGARQRGITRLMRVAARRR